VAQKIKDLGEAKGEIVEKQIEYDLMAAASANVTYTSDSATSDATMTSADVLTQKDLRIMALALQNARVDRHTKIIKGSTNIATKVVGKAYYAYVGPELRPTLEDMRNTAGTKDLWEPVESYADGAGMNVAEGEIGRIGEFRFIEVQDLTAWRGAGADVDSVDDNDEVSGVDFYTTVTANDTVNLDLFPILVVGNDSFATVGFEGASAMAKHIPPKADAHNDIYGEIGAMSVKWWHGTLIKKPEAIMMLKTVAKLA
jgi:N4-gp56 family major capsid protein